MGPGTFKLMFLGLMASGLPVAIAMAGASLVYVMVTGNIPDYVVIHRMVGGLDSFPLLAVPFFIFAGNLMNSAGITNRIYNFALALVGWMRGGLGHVNVVGSVIFAGMSGTAIADAAGLGTIEIKAMTDHGYSKEFSVGVTAASATLGPIIPPSLPFVIYALFANVSVGALFLAGILPGAVMAILMMLTVAYYAHKNKWGADVPFQWPRVRQGAGRDGDRDRMAHRDLGRGGGGGFGTADRHAGHRAALRRRLEIQVPGGAADHDAGAADRRHDDRRVHRDRGRHRRVRLGALPRARVVSHAELEDAGEGLDGHDRDHRRGALHRRRGVDLRLDAHRHAHHRDDRGLGAVGDHDARGDSCCSPTC